MCPLEAALASAPGPRAPGSRGRQQTSFPGSVFFTVSTRSPPAPALPLWLRRQTNHLTLLPISLERQATQFERFLEKEFLPLLEGLLGGDWSAQHTSCTRLPLDSAPECLAFFCLFIEVYLIYNISFRYTAY